MLYNAPPPRIFFGELKLPITDKTADMNLNPSIGGHGMNRYGYCIEHTRRHVHVEFEKTRPVLSSAPLNGGMVQADHILNLRVEKNAGGSHGPFEPLEVTIGNYCTKMGWSGHPVGMMTAADAESFRKVCRKEQGVQVCTLVTTGISNARRAGDRAECRDIAEHHPGKGTINIIILTNAGLTAGAMVEAVITATEAKTAILQDLGILNPVTGSQATGTGTDAIAIVGGFGPIQIQYCGKHMLFGEMIASTTMNAIKSSLKKQPGRT